MKKCTWKSDNLVNGYKNYMLSIKSTDNKLRGKDLTSVKFVSRISSQTRQKLNKCGQSNPRLKKMFSNLGLIFCSWISSI